MLVPISASGTIRSPAAEWKSLRFACMEGQKTKLIPDSGARGLTLSPTANRKSRCKGTNTIPDRVYRKSLRFPRNKKTGKT